MAELDDFFAKKDRKKSKSKKFATAEELAKKIEDTSKKVRKPEPRPTTIVESEENSNPEQVVNEDEWKEFAEEERKDYTGLKIGNLTMTEEDNQANTGTDGDGGSEGDSDNEAPTDNSERRSTGPWHKKLTASEKEKANEAAAAAVIAAATAAAALAAAEKATPSVYVSPAMRNQLMGGSKSKGRKGIAPDLSNEEYFPTLGAAAAAAIVKPEPVKKRTDPGFEEVKFGSRAQKSSEMVNAPLSVGNRFNSLSGDAS